MFKKYNKNFPSIPSTPKALTRTLPVLPPPPGQPPPPLKAVPGIGLAKPVTPANAPPLPPKNFAAPPSTYQVQGTSNNFTAPAQNSSAEAFDLLSGIKNESPEVVALSNFVPCYDDAGIINSTGEFLQSKQDSILVSTTSAINSILQSGDFDVIKTAADQNRKEIQKFCTDFSNDVTLLLSNLENVRSKFDFSANFSPVELEELKKKSVISLNSSIGMIPVQDVLQLNELSTVNNWTTTKRWMQSCVEFKDIIKNGTGTGLFSIGTPPALDDNEKNAFKITSPRNSKVAKFGFNTDQLVLPEVFNSDINLSENFVQLLSKFSPLFQNPKYKIFNQDINIDLSSAAANGIDDSIARISYLLCKEAKISYQLKPDSNIRKLLQNHYGYPTPAPFLLKAGNLNFWDYLFGISGSDITDISPSPIGAGNSLISLAQSKETTGGNNVEVLTFETRYVKDDFGTSRPNVVLTPGFYYYLESTITPTGTAQGFDTSRLDAYLTKLDIAFNMLQSLKDATFDSNVLPRLTPQQQGNGINLLDLNGDVPSVPTLSTAKDALQHPITLLRLIEQIVIRDGGLTPTDITNSILPLVTTSQGTALPADISPILISAALENPSLMNLLFMYQVGSINESLFYENAGNNQSYNVENNSSNQDEKAKKDPVYKEKIAEQIISVLFRKLEQKGGNSNQALVKITSEDIKNCLNPIESVATRYNINILKLIGNVLKAFVDIFSKSEGNFFVIPANTDSAKSLYSGIQKTTFLVSLFYLCCLMVHAANPERLVSREGTITAADFYVFQKLDLTVGSFSTIFGNVSRYAYDDEMVSAENLIASEVNKIENIRARFASFTYILQKNMLNFKQSLQNGKFSSFFNNANAIIQDPALTRLLSSQEQLSLIRNKLLYVATRTSETYNSVAKQIVPYFTNLQNNKDVDLFLPIEDVNFVSWNFFLKSYLNKPEFRQAEGFNKKILSVGIPQKMYKNLNLTKTSTQDLKSAIPSGIISVNLYRIDGLRPDLVHKPLKFLFDLNKYPTRTLNYFFNAALNARLGSGVVDQTSRLDNAEFISYLPFFNLQNFNGTSDLRAEDIIYEQQNQTDEEVIDPRYSMLTREQRTTLLDNHIRSFFMEQYLSFISDVSFDEHKYGNYSTIRSYINSSFQEFISGVGGNISNFKSPERVDAVFSKNSFLSDVNEIKRSFITPKKFDRVFHVIFDPDDFQIEKLPKMKSNEELQAYQQTLRAYQAQGFLGDINQDIILRPKAGPADVSFDSYYIEVEAHDSVEDSSQYGM